MLACCWAAYCICPTSPGIACALQYSIAIAIERVMGEVGADIAVSDRRLPKGCVPRWLKLDRAVLAHTGGVAITLADARVRTVRGGGRHPWERGPSR